MFNVSFALLKLRLFAVSLLVVAGIAALLARLHHLTLGTERKTSTREVVFRERTLMTPPARGIITDRWGQPVADVEPRIDLDISLVDLKTIYRERFNKLPFLVDPETDAPSDRVDIEQVVNTLLADYFKILGDDFRIDRAALERHDQIRDNVPFTIRRGLTFQDVAEISEKTPVISGVNIVPRAVRFYPFGASASHIVGYVGEPQRRADHLLRRGPHAMEAEIIGRAGVERHLDAQLQGLPGYRTVEVDYLGVIRRVVDDKNKATIGNTVYLTIDMRIQQIVERVMAGVGRGACVVMDVNNGDILAMVSIPNFDPNLVSNPEILRQLTENPAAPLFNRAVAAYAPGSAFKPVVALTALHYNVIDRNFRVNNPGFMMVANRQKKCWSFDRGGLGVVDLLTSIQKSCNVYYYTIATLRPDFDIMLHEMTDMFGFGQRTGIPVSGEEAGIIPWRDWLKSFSRRDRWSVGHMANTTIGQGYTKATPLQMASFTATLANGGFYFRPRLISKIEDPWGTLVWPEDPAMIERGELIRELPVATWKIELIKEGMRRAVNVTGGTAGRARLPNVEIAGKTGTAQFTTRIEGRTVKVNRAWFISFAPYDRPAYSVTMVVEGGESGGRTAAPLVREIYKQIFELEQGIWQPLAYFHPYQGHLRGGVDITNLQTTPPTGTAVRAQIVEPTPINEMPDETTVEPQIQTPETAPVRRATPVRRGRI